MSNSKPKISVLMPVYNAEKFVGEAIESILNQTFRDFEFLIINDASTDNSKKIIFSYKDPRIRYFKNSKNLGVARTLNKGLKLAKGEYIARMDADDISFSKRLELQYKNMLENKEIAVLASIYDIVDEDGKFLCTEKYAELPEEIYYTLQFRNCLGHPTVMFRKYIILDIFNGYDEERESEDYDLWLRISSKYKISKINICLLKLRTSRNSRMGAMSRKIDNDAIFLAKESLELLAGGKIDLAIVKILRKYFSAFYSCFSVKFSKEEIKKTLIILQRVNNKILINHPAFLNSSVLEKIVTKKYNSLKHDLYFAKLFDLKFGYILKLLFRIYFFVKRKVLKYNQLDRYLIIKMA